MLQLPERRRQGDEPLVANVVAAEFEDLELGQRAAAEVAARAAAPAGPSALPVGSSVVSLSSLEA